MTVEERVREMRQRDPRVRAATMAKHIGTTRQNVRRILIKLGLPTKVTDDYDPLCPVCHKPESRHDEGAPCTSSYSTAS